MLYITLYTETWWLNAKTLVLMHWSYVSFVLNHRYEVLLSHQWCHMSLMVSQITGIFTFCSITYSGQQQWKYQGCVLQDHCEVNLPVTSRFLSQNGQRCRKCFKSWCHFESNIATWNNIFFVLIYEWLFLKKNLWFINLKFTMRPSNCQ